MRHLHFLGVLLLALVLSGCSLALPNGQHLVVQFRVAIEALPETAPSPPPDPTAVPLTVRPTATPQPARGRVVTLAPGVHPSMTITEPGLTVRGQPGAIIRATDWTGVRIQADNVTLEGVTIQGGRFGVFITAARGVVIRDCDISGASWAGVLIAGDLGPASENTIQGCTIHHNAVEGVYIRGTDAEHSGRYVPMVGNAVLDNEIHHNGGEGVQNTATFGPPPPSGTVIRGNRIHDNGGDWGGGMCLEGDGLIVEGNEVWANGGRGPGGIYLANATGGRIASNTVYHNTGAWNQTGIVLDKATGITMEGNQVYGN